MREVAAELRKVMDLMCEMESMDEFSFYFYGRRVRQLYKEMTGEEVRWFNINALED